MERLLVKLGFAASGAEGGLAITFLGVGAAVVGLVVIAGVVYWIVKKRRNQTSAGLPPYILYPPDTINSDTPDTPKKANTPVLNSSSAINGDKANLEKQN